MAAALVAVAVVAGPTGGGATAGAAPGTGAPTASLHSIDGYAEGHGPRDIDNRTGSLAPTGQQRALAGASVSFNALGTPSALGPAAKGLMTGLSADPETAARDYLIQRQDLFGLDADAVKAMDKVLVQKIGAGAVVLLRQRFGELEAGHDGLVAVLVKDGTVLRVTSSLTRDTRTPEPATLSAAAAIEAALRDAGVSAEGTSTEARLVAVPTPLDGPRAAYHVTLVSPNTDTPVAFSTYIDARTGGVLVREDLVDFDSDNPKWAVFPSTPAAGNRVTWCQTLVAGCVKAVSDPNSKQAWDVDLTTGLPTFTSSGNSAQNVVNWGGGNPAVPATTSPLRNYNYPFSDPWRTARCDPAVFTSAGRNDSDAAVANLFAMHNRMHDWSFNLGFTEAAWNMQVVNLTPDGLGGDAEQGRAQAGAVSGSRNNANQGTGRDGQPPTTNMFLWQPIAGTSYPPCVDGDFDMTVIGHEYTHAITNRMIAGPNSGIGGSQGGSMGESWGDLLAAEYLFEYGFRAPGNTPFVTGGYVTGNVEHGIRNYDFSKSTLNYSDVGYDRVGPEVHTDGEIWSATNLRVRTALVGRYGQGTPSLQARCADGLVNVNECPGNRRWAQLVFDSFLLQAASQVSMLDMRDNMLAADLVRFEGANQDIIWGAFAESGMGMDAATTSASDTDPTPSFASPFAQNATVTLRPLGESAGAVIRLYVGDWEARAVPVADTDPETDLPDTFQIVPNKKFTMLAVGAGYGHHRFSTLFLPNRAQELKLNLPRNVASTAQGATLTGDGVNLDKLADETEATNWAALDGVAGKQITIDLAGDLPQIVSELNVSALTRPAISGDADPGAQNVFSALRSFEVLACFDWFEDCTSDSGYRRVYTSPSNAFPGGAFRPYSVELNMRSFHILPTLATHLRLRVLTSQCTGGPLYAGEQDNDPRAATDCRTASPARDQVRITEFQAFWR
jgi:hypothetical protein